MTSYKFTGILLSIILFSLFACTSTKESTKIEKEVQYSYTKHNVKYLDLKVGGGNSPKIGDRVTINTKVMTEDGTVLEDTFTQGEPSSFVLYDIDSNKLEVIRGLADGIMTMKEGGKRKLWVPADMGFGSRRHSSIPGNSTLIIIIELLDIK